MGPFIHLIVQLDKPAQRASNFPPNEEDISKKTIMILLTANVELMP